MYEINILLAEINVVRLLIIREIYYFLTLVLNKAFLL